MGLLTDGEVLSYNREAAANRGKAEYYLLHYDKELERFRAERESYLSKDGEVPETAGFDPTERVVVRGEEFDRKSEARRWLQAVEVVERGLSGSKRLFLAARREAETRRGTGFRQGRPGWVTVTQQIYARAMEREYLDPCAWLAERTMKSWWYELVMRVASVELQVKGRLLERETKKPS